MSKAGKSSKSLSASLSTSTKAVKEKMVKKPIPAEKRKQKSKTDFTVLCRKNLNNVGGELKWRPFSMRNFRKRTAKEESEDSKKARLARRLTRMGCVIEEIRSIYNMSVFAVACDPVYNHDVKVYSSKGAEKIFSQKLGDVIKHINEGNANLFDIKNRTVYEFLITALCSEENIPMKKSERWIKSKRKISTNANGDEELQYSQEDDDDDDEENASSGNDDDEKMESDDNDSPASSEDSDDKSGEVVTKKSRK